MRTLRGILFAAFVLAFGWFSTGAARAEVLPAEASLSASGPVSWPDQKDFDYLLEVKAGPEGADFNFEFPYPGWGLEGVSGTFLSVGQASLDGPGKLTTVSTLVADPMPTACWRGGFGSTFNTYNLKLGPGEETTVINPAHLLGARLAGMNTEISVNWTNLEDPEAVSSNLDIRGTNGVRIVTRVQGTNGKSVVRRRPWGPMRLVGRTYPPLPHRQVQIWAELRQWHDGPGRATTRILARPVTDSRGRFQTKVVYLLAKADWVLTSKLGQSGRFDPASSCGQVVSISGADYDWGYIGDRIPTVNDLLDKTYESVRAVGNPVIQGKTIEIQFSKHATNPNLPKMPTLVVYAGCNTWGSKYRITKGRLYKYGETDSSAVGCEEDLDPWLMKKFSQGLQVRLRGKRLILSQPNRRVRFVFKPGTGFPGE